MLGRPNFLKASLMLLLASGLPLTGCGDGSGPTPTPTPSPTLTSPRRPPGPRGSSFLEPDFLGAELPAVGASIPGITAGWGSSQSTPSLDL